MKQEDSMFGLGKKIKELRSTNDTLRKVAAAQERVALAQQRRLSELAERERELLAKLDRQQRGAK